MKKTFTPCIIALSAAWLLCGCSSWKQVTVRISEQELCERVSENFPISKSYLFVGTATYANPRIHLRKDDARVGLGLDITLTNALGSDSTVSGTVEVLASVLYNPEKKALYLSDPQLQKFVLNGAPEQNVRLLSELCLPAIEKLLRRNPVYRFKSGYGLKKIAAMLIKDVRVNKGRLEIVLGL